MVLKLEKLFRMLHCGFGRREITWLKPDFLMCRWISSLEGWITGYSNGKNLHIAWFYGLEEDITWYSNRGVPLQAGVFGLEEDKITWYSNLLLRCKDKEIAWYSNWLVAVNTGKIALEKSKIAWFSIRLSLTEVECIKALEVKEITGYSNSVTCQRQQSISSLQILGLDGGEITWCSNSCCYRSTRFGEEKATWYSNQEGGLPG